MTNLLTITPCTKYSLNQSTNADLIAGAVFWRGFTKGAVFWRGFTKGAVFWRGFTKGAVFWRGFTKGAVFWRGFTKGAVFWRGFTKVTYEQIIKLVKIIMLELRIIILLYILYPAVIVPKNKPVLQNIKRQCFLWYKKLIFRL